MIETILSVAFPPSLESLGKVWPKEDEEFDEQGACGKAQRKKYRDALHRVEVEGL
jgi:hypothetical protein